MTGFLAGNAGFPDGREATIERRGYCYVGCVVMIPMP
jgi:hypothetical protein